MCRLGSLSGETGAILQETGQVKARFYVHTFCMHDPNDPTRQPLDAHQIEIKLAELAGWEADADVNTIFRTFTFSNFAQGMTFANAVARLADEQNHHPDLLVQFKSVTVTLTTHSAGSVTEQDFLLASNINRLPEALGEVQKPEGFLAG